MLGTLVGAALPILSALVGVGIGVLAALSLSGVVDMVSVTPVLGVMLGLAVGIDYALFIVNRHRRQLKEGYEPARVHQPRDGHLRERRRLRRHDRLHRAARAQRDRHPVPGRDGHGRRRLRGDRRAHRGDLHSGAAQPHRRARPQRPRARRDRGARGPGRRTARPPDVDPSSHRTRLLGVAALGVLAVPAMSMRLGLPDGSSESPGSTQNQAYTTVAEKFGAGVNGPLLVVADLPGSPTEDEVLADQVRIGQQLAAFADVVAVAPIGTSADRTTIAFQVVPADGPTSVSTEQLVKELRAASPLDGGVQIAVAGQASGNIDISQKLADALPLYLGLVVGLSLLIMVVVFRSILVPLIATGGFILSLFAAFGGVVAIYQWGWLGGIFGAHTGPILNFLPTILVGILFGLAMDYMLFLTTGMREAYVHGAPARTAVVLGVRAGRSVVTAAAIIMVSVFGGFIFSESAMIQPIGFALAFGVLLDAFVVRMFIVPALMHLAGDWAWWLPKWLDRLIPNVDVEGAALERRHPHVASEHIGIRWRGDRAGRFRDRAGTSGSWVITGKDE